MRLEAVRKVHRPGEKLVVSFNLSLAHSKILKAQSTSVEGSCKRVGLIVAELDQVGDIQAVMVLRSFLDDCVAVTLDLLRGASHTLRDVLLSANDLVPKEVVKVLVRAQIALLTSDFSQRVVTLLSDTSNLLRWVSCA